MVSGRMRLWRSPSPTTPAARLFQAVQRYTDGLHVAAEQLVGAQTVAELDQADQHILDSPTNPPGQPTPVFHPVVKVRRSRRSLLRVMITISDTGPVPAGQRHLGCRSGVIETMGTGASVEVGDEVPGWGDHDRVEPRRPIGNPSAEGILGRGGYIADMNTTVIEVNLSASGSPSRRVCDAAASAGSVKRCSSVRRRAPWVCLMSRRTPPAPIAASC
jgi:hypothetical protein